MPNRSSAVQACLPAMLFAVYPVAVVVGRNVPQVPIDAWLIARATAVAVLLTAALLIGLRAVWRNLDARAAWLAWVWLLFGLYGHSVAALRRLDLPLEHAHPWFALFYAVSCLAAASAISRPWEERRPRHPARLSLLASAFVVGALLPALENRPLPQAAWRRAADALAHASLAASAPPAAAPARDIYYIVLDGFGSAATLRDKFDLDLAPFTDGLRARGFQVLDRSRANYAQTYLSLASALNMAYVDDIVNAVGRASPDRRPLHYLIQQNALMRLASRAGYRVLAVGSNYMATERIAAADDCVCDPRGLDEFELAALGVTPLGALAPDRWTYQAHRDTIIEAFDALESAPARPGPTFVFAHVLAPHPPFVFGPDGGPRRPPAGTLFSFGDGTHFRGEHQAYVRGYRDQVAFVTARLERLVGRLLDRPGSPPVIVLIGDHGPGSRLDWQRESRTDMRERMDIFAAYYFPEGPVLYPGMTPVNGTRALARQYLGAALPMVPERSLWSTWDRPYNLVPESRGR